MENYYFDASDAAATDPNAAWLTDDNAFDGSTSTQATVNLNGSVSTNFLMAEGTNAPADGQPFSNVSVRLHMTYTASSNTVVANVAVYTDGLGQLLGTLTTVGFSGNTPYTDLAVPTGGWTYAKLQALEVKIYLTANIDDSARVGMVQISTGAIPGAFYMRQGYQ